jgi:hypothetical protein
MTDQSDDDSDPGGVELVDIRELIPSEWHGQQTWVSSYRAYGLPQAELGATEPFELLGVRGQLFWGGAPYLEIKASMEPQIDGSVVVHQEVGDFKHAPCGPYLLLMAPTRFGATPTAEEDTRSRLRSVLALLRLTVGRNVAVEQLGELIYTASTRKATVIEAFRPPGFDPPPDLSQAGLGLISELNGVVHGLSEQQRNRVELSLQWCFRATETIGINAFLMYWFALDALAMSRRGGLAPVEEQLARIYQIDRPGLRSRFRLGQLLGVRDRIVHEGFHPVIHTRVLDLMGAVYWDLLLDILGLDPRRAAGRIVPVQDMNLFPWPS